MRNTGASFATTVNWVFVYLVVVVMLTVIESIHWKYYMLYAIFNICFMPLFGGFMLRLPISLWNKLTVCSRLSMSLGRIRAGLRRREMPERSHRLGLRLIRGN